MVAVLTDRAEIKTALHEFAYTSLGLPAAAVIWEHQNQEKRTLPMATIAIRSDNLEFGLDERFDEFNDTVPELDRITRGMRRMTFAVTAYTDAPQTPADKTGLDLVSDMLAVYRSESITEILRNAGLAVLDHNGANQIPALVGERFEHRAIVEFFIAYAAGTIDAGLTDAWIDEINEISESAGTLTLDE